MKRNDAKPMPPLEYLKECFDYDAESGLLTWRGRPRAHFVSTQAMNTFNANFKGRLAGHTDRRGYLFVHVEGKLWLAHRVIWKMVRGVDPAGHVDHRDNNKSNNRFSNLREASHQQNSFNRGASAKSRTGVKGVTWDASRCKYAAWVTVEGRTKSVGRYSSIREAQDAQVAAERTAYGEFSFHESQAETR